MEQATTWYEQLIFSMCVAMMLLPIIGLFILGTNAMLEEFMELLGLDKE